MSTTTLILRGLLATTLMMSSFASEMVISDFSNPEHREMETVDDPVMGGSSHSTFHVQQNDCLVWEGEVEIVSFLNSPGFCILETSRRQVFAGLGGTTGISFVVKTEEASAEVKMLAPMAAQITTGAKSAWGYLVTYVGILEERGRDGGVVELYAPWDTFRATFRGHDIDAPELTPVELDKTYRVGLSTYSSHKAGKFHVELVKIVAPWRE